MDKEMVLSRATPAQRAIYDVVRASVNRFEQAAPWRLLYYPPEDPAALLVLVRGLMEVVDGMPARVQALTALAPTMPPPRDGEATLEETGFLLDGIHQMVGLDVRRIKLLVAVADSRSLSFDECLNLCELAADLKGKYLSAMMGAAASIVGGVDAGVEIEPILFPEKAEEFKGTLELVTALNAVLDTVHFLAKGDLFAEVMARWGQGERVDQYALGDLAVLRGRLGRLLKESGRRALYSGDYHELSAREMRLSARINEMERLHQGTWARGAAAGERDHAAAFQRLLAVTAEIAAILDIELLKALIGEGEVIRLRGMASDARLRANDDARGVAPLVRLLAQEDLQIFLQALLNSVSRRASVSPKKTSGPVVTLRTDFGTESLAPSYTGVVGGLGRLEPEVEGPSRALAELRGLGGDPAAIGRALAVVSALVSTANPNWKSFQMTKRLLEKSARVPAAMYQALRPFLLEVSERVVPLLWQAAPCPGLSPEDVDGLRDTCEELLRRDPESARISASVPKQLDVLVQVLERFRTASPFPERPGQRAAQPTIRPAPPPNPAASDRPDRR